MEHQAHLIPFRVEEVEKQAMTIPYGVTLHQAPEVWEQGEKGEGIVVAVLDTGLDISHPDLKECDIGGRNFTTEGRPEDYRDFNGHGTHVAGTIAAAENGSGVVGVAPKAKILTVKVLDRNGGGNYWSIIEGIKFATNWRGKNGERVRVINMSLGGSVDDRRMQQAILDACSKGILVVAAAGNEGDANEETFEYSFPSAYNECITVAACDKDKKLANFSNNHLEIDIIAAGVDVLSTYPTSQFARLSGTSMAAPHVAGLLALIINIGERQFRRGLTESEIYALLVKCCCSLGYKKSSEGNGLPEGMEIYKHCQA
jgi:major intracellular serine protease